MSKNPQCCCDQMYPGVLCRIHYGLGQIPTKSTGAVPSPVKFQVDQLKAAELLAMVKENEALKVKLGVAVGAVKEFKAILSAHEWAIRNDHGNSNWEVITAKIDQALQTIRGDK